jgi:hypothetical protein
MNNVRAILVTAAVAGGLTGDAFAVCLDDRGISGYHIPLAKEAREAYSVAVGKVLVAKDAPAPTRSFDDGTLYHFVVEETLRGRSHKTFDLFSENNSGRFWMDVGHRYLVFISRRDNVFFVSNCGSSGELPGQRAVVETLRKAPHRGDG